MKRRTFVLLCLEGSVLSFSVAAAAALIPSVAAEFAKPYVAAGRIVWLYMFAYALGAFIYGPLARTFDTRRIKLIFLLLFSFAAFSAGFSQGINALFISRFFMGLFGASIIPLALILIANSAESGKRGKLVGMFFSATFVSSLAGLFLSGILNWRMIFLIPAAAGLALWISMYFYLPGFKGIHDKLHFHYLSAFKDKQVAAIFIYIFFISLIYHGVQQWLGVYFASKFGLRQFAISMLITLTSLSGVFGEALGGRFADRFGRAKVVNAGIILMIAVTFLLLFKLPVFMLAPAMIVWGLGWTFNHAGLSTVLTDLPKTLLNEAVSLNSGVRFFAGALGAALGGFLMQKSFSLNFLVFGIGLVVLRVFTEKGRIYGG